MALTDGLKLPIPELTEMADGPDAFSDLANSVEDYVYDRILPTGVTRYPSHDWGAVNTLPSGALVRPGDTAYLTPNKVLLVWNGTNWRQTEIPLVVSGDTTAGAYVGQYREHAVLGLQRWTSDGWRNLGPAVVANVAGRDAIATADRYSTLRATSTDEGITWQWTGTAWRKISGRPELIASNHTLGASGSPPVQAWTAVRSMALPVHTPGWLRVQMNGIWAAGANQATHLEMQYANAVVAGSKSRTHNNGLANAPVAFNCEGHIYSDGTAGTMALWMWIEASTTTVVVDATARAWLL